MNRSNYPNGRMSPNDSFLASFLTNDFNSPVKSRTKTPQKRTYASQFTKFPSNATQDYTQANIAPYYRVIHSNKYGFITPANDNSMQNYKSHLRSHQIEQQLPSKLLTSKLTPPKYGVAREYLVPRVSSMTPVASTSKFISRSSTPTNNLNFSTIDSRKSSLAKSRRAKEQLNPKLRLIKSRTQNSSASNQMDSLVHEGRKSDSKYLDISIHSRSPSPRNASTYVSARDLKLDDSAQWEKRSRAKANLLRMRSRQSASRRSISFDDNSFCVTSDLVVDRIQKPNFQAICNTVPLRNASFYLQKENLTKIRNDSLPIRRTNLPVEHNMSLMRKHL